MIDKGTLDDIRSKINPQHQHTIGTESYERKLLVDEIDRLRSNDKLMHEVNCKLSLTNIKYDELYLAVNKMVAAIGAYGEVDSQHQDVSAVMDALFAIDGGAA